MTNSSYPPLEPALQSVLDMAQTEGMPIIRPDTARFLDTLLTAIEPKRILEIGCCIGFSAGLMARRMEDGGELITIDRYPYMIDLAIENIKTMGLENRIRLLVGHAQEILPLLSGQFDFIFVDASKAQYPLFLEQALPLLRTGGMICFDDVNPHGILETERLNIPRRNRTTHSRMRQFISDFTEHPELVSTILNIGEGLAVATKI